MGRKYVYTASSASSDSDSDSSTPPPRQHRLRQHRSHKRTSSPPAPQLTGPSLLQSSTNGNSNEDKKKKRKKPKKPPQESIDQIWDKFSQKKFSKALAVLPFAPVPASASGERGNELLSAGFERAAEECRRKVRKIITECKRVNTRYRDPGWDLDWDFKWEKGHCLNSLDRTKFPICHANLINPSSNIPKAVKRVHEIYEKPTFMESILPGDIKQGSLGNCWFVACLTGLANVADGIKRVCVEYDTKIGIYGFVFYRDGEWIYSIIDDKLYLRSPCWDSQSMQRELLQQIDREDVERVYRQTYQTGSKALFFAQNKSQNETWVPLIEKAYAKAHGDFACLAGGWIGEALEDLSGGVTTELLASDIFDTDAFWDNELCKVNQEFLFGCSTGLLDAGYGEREGISEGHAYVIMEARTLKDGTRLCKLRNPWGKIKKGNWEGAWSDGSKEWTTEVQEELNHNFGSDSTFWISYEDLLRKYQHFDRTRLFRDPDWRSCQRWIGVEVPWKPQYNEKFHLKLTKESPLVLVLSQLDNRYFRGLQGQYNFRLQFRLHEEGKPGAEEYIVRSHGNYLMDRSVSVELPSLEPGNYVVYISVMGERNTRLLSTEDVIKRECKSREENEKLAQVGQAYDLAHSKAASHLQRLFKIRKQAESKKASESRRKERKKNWEKRQTGREIAEKQKQKDQAKKAKLKAAKKAKAEAEAEARKAAEHEASQKEAAQKECRDKTADQQAPRDRGVQTDAKSEKDEASRTETDGDNVSTTSTSSSSTGTPQYTPQDSPKTESALPIEGEKHKVDVPPVGYCSESTVSCETPSRPVKTPPPQPHLLHGQNSMELKLHYCSCSSCKPPPKAEETDYSSDSPVEDYERLYDEDDLTPTLRLAGAPAPAPGAPNDQESEDEDVPDPWNAIAVIGIRVYSKDEDLELRVIMEGGELEQDGMGNLGEADLDNAVSNAAGQREAKKLGENRKLGDRVQADAEGVKKSTSAADANVAAQDAQGHKIETGASGTQEVNKVSGDGRAAYRTIIERKTSEFDRVMRKSQVDRTEDEAAGQETPPGEATNENQPSTDEAQEAAVVDESTKSGEEPCVQTTEEKSPEPGQGCQSGADEHEQRKKTIMLHRRRLQKGMLNISQDPKEEDMPSMSSVLAELEGSPDLEANIIRATKIHRVLKCILKLARIPRDEEFSFSSRTEALLDDYELTLLTADDAEKVTADAVYSEDGNDSVVQQH